MAKNKKSYLILAVIVFVSLVAMVAIYAWTEPTSPPPNDNVDAPINVSANAQIKAGPLQVNGFQNIGTTILSGGLGSQSALYIPDGKYAQFEDNNPGAPPAGDCDCDSERGRISIDTANNRLYICNGSARGWDYIPLVN